MGRASRGAEDIFYGLDMEDSPLPDLQQALAAIEHRAGKETVVLFSSSLSETKGDGDFLDDGPGFIKVEIKLYKQSDNSLNYRSIFKDASSKGLLYQGPDLGRAVTSACQKLQENKVRYPFCHSLGRKVANNEDIPLPSEKGLEKEIIDIAAGTNRGVYSGEITLSN